MSPKIDFTQLLELNLRELIPLGQNDFVDKDTCFYFNVIVAYCKDDIRELIRLAIENPKDGRLKKLAQLRLEIRQKKIDLKTVKNISASLETDDAVAGEIAFVLGFAYEGIGNHSESKKYYRQAYEILDKVGVKKKSVRALHNVIAAESRIYPDKKLIMDYIYVANRARKIREFGITGLAHLNVSREYQIIGALDVALKFCNSAIKYMKKEEGSIQYYLAVVHRAHLLIQLNRLSEAKMDYQLASICPYPEVQGKSAI